MKSFFYHLLVISIATTISSFCAATTSVGNGIEFKECEWQRMVDHPEISWVYIPSEVIEAVRSCEQCDTTGIIHELISQLDGGLSTAPFKVVNAALLHALTLVDQTTDSRLVLSAYVRDVENGSALLTVETDTTKKIQKVKSALVVKCLFVPQKCTVTGYTQLRDTHIDGSLEVTRDTTTGSLTLHPIAGGNPTIYFQDNAGRDVARITASSSGLVLSSTTVTSQGSFNVIGDLNVTGTTNISSATSLALHELLVTKGVASGSQQFNSVKAAVDSITDNSSTNRYVVRVGPGVFIEDTITLKPYVSVVGDASLSSVVQSLTGNNIFVGCDGSMLADLTIQGATNLGMAAIALTVGKMSIRGIRFGSNDRLISAISIDGDINLFCQTCRIFPGTSFSQALHAEDGGNDCFIVMKSFAWTTIPVGPLTVTDFFYISGAKTEVVADAVMIHPESFVIPTGNALTIQDGAKLDVNACIIEGFVNGIYVPNVGTGPIINASDMSILLNTHDVLIEHPATQGSITGLMARAGVLINPLSSLVISFADEDEGGSVLVGNQFVGDTIDQVTNMSTLVQQGSNIGEISGGLLTSGAGLSINLSAGSGYLMINASPTDYLHYTPWNAQAITLPANQDNWIYIDKDGVIQTSLARPDVIYTILVGKARTDASSIVYIQQVPRLAYHEATLIDRTMRQGVGNIYYSGSLVTKDADPSGLMLDVTQGRYFFGSLEFDPSGGTPISSMLSFYRNGSGNYIITSTTEVDYDHWDNGTGVLDLIPTDSYARHSLYVVGDGGDEKYLMVYGQTLYSSLIDAQNGSLPTPPSSWSSNIALISSFIVTNTPVAAEKIVAFYDERPRLTVQATAQTGVTVHGELSGLSANDHPQYLQVNGSAPMEGNLNMGDYNITTSGLVDGVDVSAHESRHLPNGEDPLTTAAPVTISTSNSIGIANSFARSDHQHNHGNLTGGSLHADATTIASGFMSAANVTKLGAATAALTPNTIVMRDGSNNFSAGTITATLSGNATTATSATTAGSFSGSLAGDVTGMQSATVVSEVGGQTAANVALITSLGLTSTSATIPSTLVLRDGSGNFSAGTITANLSGNASTATSATNATMATSATTAGSFTGSLIGDVTGTQGATVVSTVGGQTAAHMASATTLALTATSANTPLMLVKRDASGNFSAGTISAALTGNVIGSSSLNVLKTGDTMNGSLTITGGTSHLSVGGDIQGFGHLDILGSSTVENDLTVTNTLYINGYVTYANGEPGLAKNELLVTKGILRAPNQFNSVKAAIDSITDNSLTNSYVVRVGPGVFVEDTITLKPYVSVVGESNLSSVVQVDSTAKNVFVGCDKSFISDLTIDGATDSGKAAVYITSGTITFRGVRFGNNDILVNAVSSVGFVNVFCQTCRLTIASSFKQAFHAEDGGFPCFVTVKSFVWGTVATGPLPVTDFFYVKGANTQLIADALVIHPEVTVPSGNGITIINGSRVEINGCLIEGFTNGIYVPNTGAGPEIYITDATQLENTNDIVIANPLTTGAITGLMDRNKVTVDSSSTIVLSFSDGANGGSFLVGDQFVGNTIDQVVNISPLTQQGANIGVISGGTITNNGGFNVSVAGGTGYLMIGMYPTAYLKYVTWSSTPLSLSANQSYWVYTDGTGIVQTTLSRPDNLTTILIGQVSTDSSGIAFIQNDARQAYHEATLVDHLLRVGVGSLYASGSLVSTGTHASGLTLNVGSGDYYFGTHEYFPSGGTPISNWLAYSRNAPGSYTITSTSQVDYNHYDYSYTNTAGDTLYTLTPLAVGEYARHSLYVVGDGADETYLFVYGQTTYPSLTAAESGTVPTPPVTWTSNIALLASLIVTNTTVPSAKIAEIVDQRPRLAFQAAASTGVTVHGDLQGLAADDHKQYLLVNGTRAMSGTLQMGANDITTTGLVDGVTVSAHASRHLPNGLDPLTTGTPVDISTANAPGIENKFSRSDHVHNHGNLAGGLLHATATGGVAGFMSAADYTKLAAATDANTPSTIVMRDGSGNFSVNSITANTFNGTVTSATNFTGVLAGDVTGLQTTTTVVSVGGQSATDVASATSLALTATSADTVLTLVKRDVAGNFSAGTITANLTGNVSGNATTATTAINFSGSLSGDVTGTQLVTTVTSVGGQSSTAVATGVVLANAATNSNTINTIVKRDGSGNFSAGTITANLSGSATSFTGSLVGNVTGTQGATVVSTVGGQSAANVANATSLALTATSANTALTLVKRDGSGNFSAGTITAALSGNATTATTSTNFSGNLAGDVTGPQGTTAVALVGGVSAATIASGAQLANAATNLDTVSTIVKRDSSGNFSAGTISANLTGTVTGSASLNVLKVGDSMTGTLAITPGSGNGLTVTGNTGAPAASFVAGAGQASALISDGTVAIPSLAFASQVNTGLYRIGSSSIGVATNGVNRMVLDTNGGRYTSNYRTSAYATTNQTTGAASVTVQINSIANGHFDPSGSFNTGTHTYTAPVTGVYLVTGRVSVQTAGGTVTRTLSLFINGSATTGYSTTASAANGVRLGFHLAELVSLTAGQTLTLNYAGTTTDVIQANDSGLNIHLMSI